MGTNVTIDNCVEYVYIIKLKVEITDNINLFVKGFHLVGRTFGKYMISGYFVQASFLYGPFCDPFRLELLED